MRNIFLVIGLCLPCFSAFAQAPEIMVPIAPQIQTPSAPFNGTMADSTAMPPVNSVNGVRLTPKLKEAPSAVESCLKTAKTASQIESCQQKKN